MTPRLQVVDLAGGYPGIRVFSAVTFHVAAGEVLTILGANGSGKSALLQTLQGLLAPTAGRILLDGRPVQGLPAEARAAAGMCLVADRRWLWPDITVREHLRVGAFRAAARAGWRQRAREVGELFPALPTRRRARPGRLSGGQQQQLALARFAMARAQVWLLDDPLQGLDAAARQRVLAWIRAAATGGATVIVTGQHIAALLELGSRALILRHGSAEPLPSGREALDDARVRALL
jgi:branched-chain amino acid transport system ATP-binding protein